MPTPSFFIHFFGEEKTNQKTHRGLVDVGLAIAIRLLVALNSQSLILHFSRDSPDPKETVTWILLIQKEARQLNLSKALSG